jgi:hypothetical protein
MDILSSKSGLIFIHFFKCYLYVWICHIIADIGLFGIEFDESGMQNANNTHCDLSLSRWQHFILFASTAAANSEMQFAYLQLFNPSISPRCVRSFFSAHAAREKC